MLVFDEKQHRYYHDEVEVPCVSRILEEAGFISEFSKNDDWARAFGVASHYMIRLDLEGNLNEDTVQEELRPALKAWRKWRSENSQLVPITDENGELLAEKPILHPLHKYAGTPDLPYTDGKKLIIVDLKNSRVCAPYWGLQTVAYEMAIRAKMSIPDRTKSERYVLMIPRGSDVPIFKRIDQDAADWPTFLGALAGYRWKTKHKMLKQQREVFDGYQ